jgi:hypothetical protein
MGDFFLAWGLVAILHIYGLLKRFFFTNVCIKFYLAVGNLCLVVWCVIPLSCLQQSSIILSKSFLKMFSIGKIALYPGPDAMIERQQPMASLWE